MTTEKIVNRFGKYIVQLECHGYEWLYEEDWLGLFEGTWRQEPVEGWGSGIIYSIGAEGQTIILTNYHVIEHAIEGGFCYVNIFDPIQRIFIGRYRGTPIYFPNLASLERMKEIDFGFLSIEGRKDVTGRYIIPGDRKITDSFPHICQQGEISLGKEVVVLGYPAIGGRGVTVSEGIISSFEHPYLVTTAKIEHGNSGGGAFLKTGCLVGIPTWVEVGKIEALGRMVDLPWLKQNYLP